MESGDHRKWGSLKAHFELQIFDQWKLKKGKFNYRYHQQAYEADKHLVYILSTSFHFNSIQFNERRNYVNTQLTIYLELINE